MNRDKQLELYQNFVINCTTNAKSVKNYSDFKRINECLCLLFPGKQDISILDFDNPVDFETIVEKLSGQKEFVEYEKRGGNQYSNTLKHYLRFLYAKKMFSGIPESVRTQRFYNLPLQQIFYGAPGTGKSFTINKVTERMSENNVFRTTFHPDSDYSTFVGCYKPTMEERPLRVVPVVISEKGTIFEQNQGTYIENKIEYSYVAQVFIKAYVRAWRIWSNDAPIISGKRKIEFYSKNGRYTIDDVDDNNLSYTRQFNYYLGKRKIKTTWDRIWRNGKFEIPQGNRPGASVEEAIAAWIYDKIENCVVDDLQKGLESLRKEIENRDLEIQGKTQKYLFHRIGDSDEISITTQNNAKKETLRKFYSEDEEPTYELHSNIIDILADYDEDDFDKAWEQLKVDAANGKKLENDDQDTLDNKVMLVVEEINRGNCAQIFGDIFQLLDRGNEGFSDYPIDSDSDIEKYLKKQFIGLEFSATQELFINNCFHGKDIASVILEGKKLVLPPNLYIWATMNTSDQSLFPIDSAFKRRWDWKYMKIRNHPEENYKIKLSDKEYDWWEFIQRINEIIASMTSSADKQLGYFFCKATDGNNISPETFVSKVIFYLWNDVFKDYGFEDESLFSYKEIVEGKEERKELTFPDFYDEDGEKVNEVRLKGFLDSVMNWKKDNNNNNG